jgi:hypothetical protein
VFQTSTDPQAKWWNDQAAALEDAARKLYLDNTDMKKVAKAVILAPAVDAYRKMWMEERKARLKSDRIIRERLGSEPTMSESGGNTNGSSSTQEDLKKPFADVFLREFHKAQSRGVR